MAFKINDYNAFLSPLVDKDKQDSQDKLSKSYGEIFPNPLMIQKPNGDDLPAGSTQGVSPGYPRFPVDFDFCLNPEMNNDVPFNPPNNDDYETYSPQKTTNSTNVPSKFSDSKSPTNDSSLGLHLEMDFQSSINPDMVSDSLQLKPSGMNRITNRQKSFLINHESSDEDMLSPDMELPDPFYSNLQSSGNTDLQLKLNSDDHELETFRPRMRSSHNVIEQRYRNKINDKFNALLDSVPTLRVVSRRKKQPGSSSGSNKSENFEEELEGLEPARKLNKGVILSKSVEYIKFLELKNNKMREQNRELLEKARMLGIPLDQL